MPAQTQAGPPLARTTTDPLSCSSSRLRTLRRSFLAQQEQRAPLMMDTLLHDNHSKKLDSWIDSVPEPHHVSVHIIDKDTCVVTLDDSSQDHLTRRVSSLSKRRSRLSRSWSGNMDLIQKDSLIDVLPKAAGDVTGKRSKPRRASGDAATAMARQRRNPKDVLTDGDIQTVRKVILERKLLQRPMLPTDVILRAAADEDSSGSSTTCFLVAEIRRCQAKQDGRHSGDNFKLKPVPQARNQRKSHPQRGVQRTPSLNTAVFLKQQRRRPVSIMPSSA